MEQRLRVGVIFGGRSVEHEVSLVSARSIIENLDPVHYEIIPVGITRSGRWVTSRDAATLLREGLESPTALPCILPPDPSTRGLLLLSQPGTRIPLDAVFPIVHGAQGEDGALQGLLELADLPYVGAGVLTSAVGMDKEVMKRLFKEAGLPVVESLTVLRGEWGAGTGKILETLSNQLGFPCFVKPANTGSSVGITKAKSRTDLEKGLEIAFRYDRKAVVEKGVDAREIECSVLGNEKGEASVPGEIVPCNEFYDYEAKYLSDGSKLLIPAPLSPRLSEEVRRMALAAFRALDGSGMARVDFLLDRATETIYVNEVNTLPGFTPISMYPKLWEASGLPYAKLLDRLIRLGVERHQDKRKSSVDFKPGASPGIP